MDRAFNQKKLSLHFCRTVCDLDTAHTERYMGLATPDDNEDGYIV